MITSEKRISCLRSIANDLGVRFVGETNTVYMARAVSSVQKGERRRLEEVFGELVGLVESSGLTPLLPAELTGSTPEEMNQRNHESLLNSKVVMPLTYAVSDGRGWEMGFAYLRKLIVPVVLPGERPNIPSVMLPYQIPVRYDPEGMVPLLKELQDYRISFGTLNGTRTVIGTNREGEVDLKEIARRHLEVIR